MKLTLTLKVMLIIAAIYWILNGLGGLLVPVSFWVPGGASAPPFLVMALRFWGVASLALGVIAWLARNAEASKTRDAVVLGSIFWFALDAAVSLYGTTIDPASPHIPFAVVEAVIGAGLFLAFRSSRATNAG